jgi:hypothetical protein
MIEHAKLDPDSSEKSATMIISTGKRRPKRTYFNAVCTSGGLELMVNIS